MAAAESQGSLERVERDVSDLENLIDASEDVQRLLKSPMLNPEAKRKVLTALLKERVCALTLSFLLLLIDRRRERVSRDILHQFGLDADERRGVITAEVRCAQPLDPGQREALAKRLSAYAGRQVQLRVEVDPKIRAGFLARIGDLVFDGTIETQMEQLRIRMLGT